MAGVTYFAVRRIKRIVTATATIESPDSNKWLVLIGTFGMGRRVNPDSERALSIHGRRQDAKLVANNRSKRCKQFYGTDHPVAHIDDLEDLQAGEHPFT